MIRQLKTIIAKSAGSVLRMTTSDLYERNTIMPMWDMGRFILSGQFKVINYCLSLI